VIGDWNIAVLITERMAALAGPGRADGGGHLQLGLLQDQHRLARGGLRQLCQGLVGGELELSMDEVPMGHRSKVGALIGLKIVITVWGILRPVRRQ
jgi:hypothetical protein